MGRVRDRAIRGANPDHPAGDRARHHPGRDRVRAGLELGAPDHRAVAVRLADPGRPEPEQDVRRRAAPGDARRRARLLPARRRALRARGVPLDLGPQDRLDRRTPGLGARRGDDPGDHRRGDARGLHPGRARAAVADRRDARGVRRGALRGGPDRGVPAAPGGPRRPRRARARRRPGARAPAGRLAFGGDDDRGPRAHVRPRDRGPVLVPALAAGDRRRGPVQGTGPGWARGSRPGWAGRSSRGSSPRP